MVYSKAQLSNAVALSIIIPVYNGGDSFRRCLESLADRDRTTTELIVVVDGKSSGSYRLAQSASANVIRLPESGGPAQARNIGAEAASGDVLFFVDADVTLHKNTLMRVQTAFAQDKTMDALIGSYDDEPGAQNFLSQYKNLFHHYTHQQACPEAFTFWGACGAVRQTAFRAVNGFDPSYRHPCVEDIDLGYRLRLAGYRICLDKEIQVKHLKEWRLKSLLKAEIFYRALPWTALLLRLKDNHPESYRRFTRDLNLRVSSRLSVILAFAFVGFVFTTVTFPPAGLAALVCMLLLLGLNLPVYQFFWRKRGGWFALRVIPCHWLYFLYGGLSFAVGTVRHYLTRWHLLGPRQRSFSIG